MGPRRPNSLQSRVEEVVLRLGECDISQVLTEVGSSISAAQAMNAYRREVRGDKYHSSKSPRIPHEERGKRSLVRDALKNLVRTGRVRRVRKGVYAPLLPKLFKAI